MGIIDRYAYSKLESAFKAQIEKDFKVSDIEIGVTGGFLTDLDNDTEHDDFAGTAILKVGRSFKSFVFLMRDDGSARFLENNGAAFTTEGRQTLFCSSKPIACPDTMARAKQQIASANFSVMEFDKTKAGLEVIFPLVGGKYNVLNSLEIFAGK
ncbi:MAG: hypothetical protein K8R69_04615 [Deltaproteobacteria bacterium]|nr:hypothetical protein [Deltaproteobacteria bacterium]